MKEYLGPGVVSIDMSPLSMIHIHIHMSPLSIIMRESCQIYLSKPYVIKKICNTSNVWLNHGDFVISFFMIRKQNPKSKK